jgi:hypothetical protein
LLGRLEQGRALIQVSGGPGTRIERRNRHLHPADKRRYLHPFEEVWVHWSLGAGVLGTSWTRDGDQGEQDDERRTRDDSGASHVPANIAWNARSEGFGGIR